MKSKCLVWFLTICLLSATTALSQQQGARPVRTQTPDNLSQDVILVPVNAPALAIESIESDEPFSINVSFNANVTAPQRAVIQQAINEWTAIIRTRGDTPGNYPITFSNGPLLAQLALTTTTFNMNNGNLISATIVIDNKVIDNKASTTWYIDPTPADDVEFRVTPPTLPPTLLPEGSDLLTVVRHELAHALGWSDTKRVTDLLSNNVFDSARFNIGTVATGGRHTDPSIHAGDVMNPSLPDSVRRPLSLYPAATMLARAYSYDITMRFVDSAYTGEETGSANKPWNTLREGADLASFGLLLLTSGTYKEALPLTLSRSMTITVARDAGAIIRKRP